MRVQNLFFTCSAACISIAAALPHANISIPTLIQSGRKGSGTLQLTIKHKNATSGLTRRQDVSVIENLNVLYLIDLTIGTPPQPVQVQLDTGSSELWVDPVCADSDNPAACESLPVYDPNNSTTADDLGYTFSIQYGTGSVDGEYLTDTVGIAGISLDQQQFGWAQDSEYTPVGILGVSLGYGFGYEGETEYNDYYCVVDSLYVQGYTASRAFGLNLGDSSLAQGTIDFGGIDTGKYIGALYKSPMIQWYDSPDGFPRYWFYMTSVGVTQPGSSTSTIVTVSDYEQPMFPDCGATYSQLPPSLFNALIAQFPTAVNNGNGIYTIDCSIRNQAGTLDFGFGTKTIHVSFYDWFRPSGTTCVFGGVSNANVFSLGDSFMRSAYIVYDQDNFNIHIAQSANCGTNVIAIGSGENAVPSVTGQCTATPTPPSTSTSSSKSSSTSSTSKTSSSSSTSKTSSSSSTKTTSSSSSSKTTSTSTSKSTSSTSSSKVSTTSSSKTTSSSSTKSTSTSTSTSKTTTSSSTKSTSTSSSTSTSKSSSKTTSTSSISSSKSSSSSTKKSTTSSIKSTSTSSSSKSSTSSTKTSSTSSSKTTSSSSTLKTTTSATGVTTEGPTTTFVSSYTSDHHRTVTTITE